MSTIAHCSTEQLAVENEAARLFAETYGLGWTDAYRAAAYARIRGSERCRRALNIVSATGCTFTLAAQAVEASDALATAA